jgi:hypothetical protein
MKSRFLREAAFFMGSPPNRSKNALHGLASSGLAGMIAACCRMIRHKNRKWSEYDE